MLTNYYTLSALIQEWKPRIEKALLLDAYSQHKGSLILVFESAGGEVWSINVSLQAPHRQLFMYSGSNRSKKNVVDVFPEMRGQRVQALDIADRERQITLTFENESVITLIVFGPQANVFLESGGSTQSFRGNELSPPDLRPATEKISADDIRDALSRGRSLNSALPLFPKPLVQEVWHRAHGSQDPAELAGVIREMESELQAPTPYIYWDEDRKPLFSLIELRHMDQTGDAESMNSVDEGVRICARRKLALSRFSGQYEPLIRMLKKRLQQAERSLERVESELSKPSRADRHEHHGHLLMAHLHSVSQGAAEVELDDILEDGQVVQIQLDTRLSPIENAQAFYEKAKRSRQARITSKERLQGLRKTVENMRSLNEEALGLDSIDGVKAFRGRNESQIKAMMSAQIDPDSFPYRRYVLDEGYEVWVGRNARQNDQLTLKDARKYDLWLHARGVAGSHTVLRLRGRTDKPAKYIVEQAASIAAWHSKARSSSLAPVIVAEKKYVRKPRKSLPGTVVVDREEVVIVEPRLPD